jgi:stress response protein SCP2
MSARSKLSDSGDVSLYNQSTLKVAQMALRESNKDSNGERENKALTKALQIKEQRATKTQMVKGKIKPSPRLCKSRSNEVVFMVFPVS